MALSTTNVKIRPFLPGDQFSARQIILEGLGEHFGNINPTLNPDLVDIETSYLKNGYLFLVAEREGTMVGTGAMVSESCDTARIVRLSVIRKQRGFGIGRLLVEHIIEAAKQGTFKQIFVETNHDWYPAIKLYESCGFHQFAKDEESIHLHLIL